MTLIRLILGKLILLLNWIFTPRSIIGTQLSKPGLISRRPH